MHVKNFSLITRDNRVEFSPAYDLLNSTLALGGAEEEMALMLTGKRKEFRRHELVDYLGRERLELSDAAIEDALNTFRHARPLWERLISISFLTPAAQQGYREILGERFGRLLG